MWKELAEFHLELGGPEHRLARGLKAEWRRFVRGHIGRTDRLCLVAEIDGEAVGFLLAAILTRPKVFERGRTDTSTTRSSMRPTGTVGSAKLW